MKIGVRRNIPAPPDTVVDYLPLGWKGKVTRKRSENGLVLGWICDRYLHDLGWCNQVLRKALFLSPR